MSKILIQNEKGGNFEWSEVPDGAVCIYDGSPFYYGEIHTVLPKEFHVTSILDENGKETHIKRWIAVDKYTGGYANVYVNRPLYEEKHSSYAGTMLNVFDKTFNLKPGECVEAWEKL